MKPSSLLSKFGLSIFVLVLLGTHIVALNPTIINGNVILCPNGQETLITQEYDTYQWYKDGNPISGATNQTLVVDYNTYAPSNVSVFVTLGSESAMSPSILVDGWVFMPIVVSSYGQGYWFAGETWEMCKEHELFFEVMLPYNTNIQWYRNGAPIPGANSAVYQVSETGVYNVSGSPEICPNYVQYSIGLPVVVHTPPKPVISQSADTLFTSVFPGQWYFGFSPIPGATGEFLIPESTGYYRFLFTDGNGCSEMSDNYFYEWDPVLVPENKTENKPHAYITGDRLYLENAEGWQLSVYSITGTKVMSEPVTYSNAIDVSGLMQGLYFISLYNKGEIITIKAFKM